jgi:mannan endo-1,4-beta-mannosidase
LNEPKKILQHLIIDKLTTMKKLLLLLMPFSVMAQSQTATLDFSNERPISPLIYGYNQNQFDHTDPNFAVRRLGGNVLTVFNWETGTSYSAANKQSVVRLPELMGIPWGAGRIIPGEVYRSFYNQNKPNGKESIITVPIVPYLVDSLTFRTVSIPDLPPSANWSEVIFKKNAPFNNPPDQTDGKVYIDEAINFMVQEFGSAENGGVKYISLDNEPTNWKHEHSHIQSDDLGIEDYISRLVAAAKAIKAVDPGIKIIVGEFMQQAQFNFGGNAPDWASTAAGYDWFTSYFLKRLKEESNLAEINLFDYYSFHYYTQSVVGPDGNFLKPTSGGVKVNSTNRTDFFVRNARMQSIRSLWDENYIEPSWLTQPGGPSQLAATNYLGRIKNSIKTYYPEMKIMIGEWNTGNNHTEVSEGISYVDALGAFAQNDVDIAAWWDLNLSKNHFNTYASSAFDLVRNYDGTGAKYGDRVVDVYNTKKDDYSIWASKHSNNDNLSILICNKTQADGWVSVGLNSNGNNKSIDGIYRIDQTNMDVNTVTLNASNAYIQNDVLYYKAPAFSASHLIISSIVTTVQSTENKENIPIISASSISNLSGNWQIIDATGKLISEGSQQTINLTNYPRGIYILRTSSCNHKFLVK